MGTSEVIQSNKLQPLIHPLTVIHTGVGHYLRGRTGHGSNFNRGMGEYLTFAYIAFYAVIFLTYAIPYLFKPRYNFEQMTTGLSGTYLLCLGLFIIFPTAGPYWQYPQQRPHGEEIGYFIAPLSQRLIEGGSSIGTAFPSSHCAVTTVSQILALIYCWQLGVAYLLICPAIVIATIWLGNHYVIDSIAGVGIGIICSGITLLVGRFWWPHIRVPLTGDPPYIKTMLTFPVLAHNDEEKQQGESAHSALVMNTSQAVSTYTIDDLDASEQKQ